MLTPQVFSKSFKGVYSGKMKLKITYHEDSEAQEVMNLLDPLLKQAKVKKSDKHAPYKHIYIELNQKKAPKSKNSMV